MRSVPERNPGLTLLVLIGVFFVGPFLGMGLADRLAPDSELSQLVSALAFIGVLLGGLLFWFGWGVAAVVVGGLWRLVRGKVPKAADFDRGAALVLPGYGAFVTLSLLLPGAAGLLVSGVGEASLLLVIGCYLGVGAAYGGALWWLAHHGYLPFPEPQ